MLMFRFLIIGLALCPLFSFSQNNFLEGYVVTSKGDTLKGYVEGKESGTTLTQVRYKANTAAAVQKFSKEDCIAFGLYDRDVYERHTVNITMSKVELRDLSVGVDTTVKRETIFLQLLQKGINVTLYAYTDDVKTRFYIKEETDLEPTELVYHRFYNPSNTSQIIDSSKFKRQLQALFRKHKVDIEDYKLERAGYAEYDILKLVSLVNNYQQEKSKFKRSTLYAGVGLTHLSTNYFGEHVLAREDVTSKATITPFVSAGIDLYVNPAYGKAFFRIETSFFIAKHKFEKKEPDFVFPAGSHEFKQFVATLSTSFLYNFYRSDDTKAYLGLGIAARYASTVNNRLLYRYTTDTFEVPAPDMQRFRLQIPVTAGIVLLKRADVSFTYTGRTNISENYILFGVRTTQFKIGLNYRF